MMRYVTITTAFLGGVEVAGAGAGAGAGTINAAAVDLGSANAFAVLAESGITNDIESPVVGDMGVDPVSFSSMTGRELYTAMRRRELLSTLAQVKVTSEKVLMQTHGTTQVNTDATEDDSCSFEGYASFSFARVMDCFQKVDFRVEDLLDAVEVLSFNREQSGLRNFDDEIIKWRQALDELSKQTFANDYDFQVALGQNHLEFQSGHVNYIAPRCYSNARAFLPFSLTVLPAKTQKELVATPAVRIFVESLLTGLGDAVLDDYMKAWGDEATLQSLVGLELVAVDGVAVLDHFANLSRVPGVADTPETARAGLGTTLNRLTKNNAYVYRSMGQGFPKKAFETWTLAYPTPHDKPHLEIKVPWRFLFRGDVSNSTDSFIQMCFENHPGYHKQQDQRSRSSIAGGGPEALGVFYPSLESNQIEDVELLVLRQRTHNRLSENSERNHRMHLPCLTHEQEAMVIEDLSKIPGRGDQEYPPVQILKLRSLNTGPTSTPRTTTTTTVLGISSFSPVNATEWKKEIKKATKQACKSSTRLVLDLSNNPGGFVHAAQWLMDHLFPPQLTQSENLLLFTYPTTELGLDVIRHIPEMLSSGSIDTFETLQIDFKNCTRPDSGYAAIDDLVDYSLKPHCVVSAETMSVFPNTSWVSERTQVTQTAQPGNETQAVGNNAAKGSFFYFNRSEDSISCPGKFAGGPSNTLVTLVDGTNGSAGYAVPVILNQKHGVVVIGLGGIPSEPLLAGTSLGGNVLSASSIYENYDVLRQVVSPQLLKKYIKSGGRRFIRNADTRFEFGMVLHANASSTFFETPVFSTLRVPSWIDTLDKTGHQSFFSDLLDVMDKR